MIRGLFVRVAHLAVAAAQLSLAVAALVAALDEIVLHPPADRRAFDASLALMWTELDELTATAST